MTMLVSWFLFIILILMCIYYTTRYFFQINFSIFGIVSLFSIINFIYLIFFVNKAWIHYYLHVVTISIMILIPVIRVFSEFNQKLFLTILLAFNIFYFSPYYQFNFKTNMGKPDKIYASMGENIAREKMVKINLEINDFILKTLKNKATENTTVLMNLYTAFEYFELGLNYHNIVKVNNVLPIYYFDESEYDKINELRYRKTPFIKKKLYYTSKRSTIF